MCDHSKFRIFINTLKLIKVPPYLSKIYKVFPDFSDKMEEQDRSFTARVTPENKKLQQTQDQINEIVEIMQVNVQKVLERDQKVEELGGRADALLHGASQFEQQAGNLKKKYWWKNLKMMIIIIVMGVIFLGLIIWWASTSGSNSVEAPAAPAPVTPAPTASP